MQLTAIDQGKCSECHPAVSIVIPVFNELESVEPLYRGIQSALEEIGIPWEVIFVDDGSTDGTYAVLQGLHESDESVSVVQLRRNFGQTAALVAGFDHAKAETIVALDGDLQNDPKDIGVLLKKLDEGFDLVSGWRTNRQEGLWLRRLPSKIANWLISRSTGTHLHDYGCTLKAYRASRVKELKLYGEMHRFIPAVMAGNGARIAEVAVNHLPRLHGKSKYGISRVLRVFLDLLMVKFFLSFLTKPLRVFGMAGLMTSVPGSMICLYLVFARIFLHQALADRPLFLLGILLTVVGVQFVSMGILAEIQIRTYHESSNRPIYTIQEVLNSHDGRVRAMKRPLGDKMSRGIPPSMPRSVVSAN